MGIRQVSDNVAIYSGRGYAQLALGYPLIQIFENYIKDHQANLLGWYKNTGGENDYNSPYRKLAQSTPNFAREESPFGANNPADSSDSPPF